MNIINKYFTILLFILTTQVFSQNFKVSSLIEIPGDNTKVDVLSPEIIGISNSETYICWLNKLDSTYTIFLKQISPFIGDNIVVASDTNVKSKPLIAINQYAQGIKIVWESKKENTWQVYLNNYFQNQLSEPEIILDSLDSEPEISLSTNRITWINNGNLLYANFYKDFSNKILLDSSSCSSPNIVKYDYQESTQIIYEKNIADSVQIHMIEYNGYMTPKFQHTVLSKGIENKNPKFGQNMDYTFQTMGNGVWKSVFTNPYFGMLDTTKNMNCNYNNPVIFTYPIPIYKSNSDKKTPYFIAFDTDSLSNNNEIFIKTLYYGIYDSLINISNSSGTDRYPQIAYLSTADSVYISIIWEHSNDEKTDLWIAKDSFTPLYTDVSENTGTINSFNLLSNYPNPFNPTTTIQYTIKKSSNVKIIVYDVMGRETKTIVDEYKKSGIYKIVFNATNLSSGIYYYSLLQNGNRIKTNSMLILK